MRHRRFLTVTLAGLLIFTLLQIQNTAKAATTLVAGDIAIIGYNFDNPDEFAFVALENIDAGTQLNFTDKGWLNTGNFRSGEGTFTWTAPATICAGEVVTPTVSGVSFAATGDQILAYQGIDASPVFIYALNSDDITWAVNANDTNTSALPTGLVDGTTAVSISEIDNAIYTGATTGTRAIILANISNPANWTGSDDVLQTMPTNPFTVTDAVSCGSDTAPQVISTSPTNGVTAVAVESDITLNFSEGVDLTATAVTIECPVGTSVTFSGLPASDVNSVTLNPDSDLPNSTTCTVTAVSNQITDNGGIQMSSNYEFTFDTAPSIASNLVINEVDYDQIGTDSLEFIELKNNSASPIDLNGYTVELVNGLDGSIYNTITLPADTIAANGYYVLCASGKQNINCDWAGAFSSLQNGAPEAIGLRYYGSLVDALSYEGSVSGYTETTGTTAVDSNTITGISLSRYADGNDTNDNDADFSVRCVTPGAANSAASTDCSITAEECTLSTNVDIRVGTATLNFANLGSPAISCIQVTYSDHDHPNASAPIETGAFWNIEPTPANAGSTTPFNYSLTLPFTNPQDPADKICRWLEGSGPGAGWDCAADGYTADSITRSGLTGFSDWAVGESVKPTAVSLQSFAGNNHNNTLIALIVITLVLMGGTAVLWYRKRSRI